MLGRKPVDQRQPVEAFAESPREIVVPALGAQSPPLPDLLHGQAVDQDIMHQRRAVGAEFALGAVQPQHRLALAFGDRLAHLPAIDIFPGRIDRARAALGPLPVVLKRPPALVLRLVDLTMRMQAAKRIVADRAQRNDLLSRLQRQGIVDLDGCDFGVARQILRSPVMRLGRVVRLLAFGSWHV